jgi:hypothetical protein
MFVLHTDLDSGPLYSKTSRGLNVVEEVYGSSVPDEKQ